MALTELIAASTSAIVAISALVIKASSKSGRTLRRALTRIEAHERYERRLRRMLDDAGVAPGAYPWPRALQYMTGAYDELDDQGD